MEKFPATFDSVAGWIDPSQSSGSGPVDRLICPQFGNPLHILNMITCGNSGNRDACCCPAPDRGRKLAVRDR